MKVLPRALLSGAALSAMLWVVGVAWSQPPSATPTPAAPGKRPRLLEGRWIARQQGFGPVRSAGGDILELMRKLAVEKDLNLTEDQKKSLGGIFDDQQQKMKAVYTDAA